MNKFPFAIGLRYTRASRKSGMLSFLSGISMAGLIVGISLLVIVLSVMNGFERELRERILGLLPHASVFKSGGIDDWQTLAGEVNSQSGVVGSAPFVQVNALLRYRNNTAPGLIYGIDVNAEKKISLIESYVEHDALVALQNHTDRILMGAELAAKMGLQVGAEVMVIAPGRNARSSARISYLKIAGLVDSGSELDQTLVLANMKGLDALRAPMLAGSVDGLRLKFASLDDAPFLAASITSSLGPSYYQTNWRHFHGNLFHSIQMSKKLVGLLMSLIVALAAFNVVSTLTLVVVEKQASVAILRTLGASSADILKIFMTQGLLIGAGGVVFGVLIGCAVVTVVEPFVQAVEGVFGVQFLHSDVYPLTSIPAEVRLGDLVEVVGVAMVLVFLSTLYPAWRATRLQPADVLRYE